GRFPDCGTGAGRHARCSRQPLPASLRDVYDVTLPRVLLTLAAPNFPDGTRATHKFSEPVSRCLRTGLCYTAPQKGPFMPANCTRRDWFRGAAAAAGTIAGFERASGLAQAAPPSAPAIAKPMDLTVKKVDATWIKVPFRPVPARNMVRELPHWTIFVIYQVSLACGVVGFGETM